MGSLPNLNELCNGRAYRRSMEKERNVPRERGKEEFQLYDKDMEKGTNFNDRLPTFVHQPSQIPRNHHQHRHSLTSRKVHRTRSSGATHHIWDDPMIEHMAAYSPISSQSHRTVSAHYSQPYQIAHHSTPGTNFASRRRESGNSSIGATSIRRLLTVNRGCRHKIPVHIRAKVAKNFTFLVIAHGLSCAVLVPLYGLQGANSLWYKGAWLRLGPNIGSMLLSICFIVTAGMCLLTTRIIKKFGYLIVIGTNYGSLCLFLLAHLYPSIYILIPAYLLLGTTLGPSCITKWNLVVFFASRISCGQHDCNNYSTLAIDATIDDHKTYCNRDQRVRRLARWYHAAQDMGIVIGALFASFVMTCAFSDENSCFFAKSASQVLTPNELSINFSSISNVIYVPNKVHVKNKSITGTMNVEDTISNHSNRIILTDNLNRRVDYSNDEIYQESTISQSEQILDSMFNINQQGERICGAGSCPVWLYSGDIEYALNYSEYIGINYTVATTMPLILIYAALGLIALTLTCLSQQVDNTLKCDTGKGMTDTFLFAGPMAYFIGTEQGYVLGDFTKAFVSCSLGPHMVAGALIGMGLMQLIVSCTLSMLLRHTKRYAVLAAGFFFHACLLLVLSRWKPSKDDSALFYVIAASWGACNGMWEILLFTFITLTHVNHIVEVSSPLQALRFLGLGITFGAHIFLCENLKLLLLVILLVISVLPYAMLEVRMETQRKNQSTNL